MSRKKIIIIGIISFILALLFQLPASMVANLAQSANNKLSLSGVRGSIWSGKALQANYDKIDLGEIKWTLNPLSLLTGALGGVFDQQGTGLSSKGEFKLGLNKSIQLTDTNFTVGDNVINSLQKYATLDGDFMGKINHLEMRADAANPLPPVISGILNWEQGAVESPITLPAGNYQLRIKPDTNGNLEGELSSNDAPLDINGTLMLDSSWQYKTNINLKTTPKGQSLTGLISMAGKRNPDGSVGITEEGNLLNLFKK